MRAREGQSGGVGANKNYTNAEGGGDSDVDDGVGGDDNEDLEDTKHTFEFCAGRMDVLYDDILVIKQVDPGVVNAVIADGDAGSGSSVPDGTGMGSATERES